MSLEWAVLFPALLLLIAGIVQGGLWFHARQLALAAAQEGVRAGRAEHAPPGTGTTTAERFLSDHAHPLLANTAVTDHSSTAEIRIHVTGETLSLVPGMRIRVTQEAAGAVERFTHPGQP
ncbi:TadE family protein [Thermobifida halotolerans]|uniref:TadE family protein n=1 Tax=Thermobifida halotolerans TaxID=483545 RepID=UPI001F18E71B|nr:TadE family protein [Thermobifida halotolerans]